MEGLEKATTQWRASLEDKHLWLKVGTSSLHSEVRLPHNGCPLQEVPNEKLGAHEGVDQPLGIPHHSLCHKL